MVTSKEPQSEAPKGDNKFISFFTLYKDCNLSDRAAIAMGVIGSFVNGLTFPLFTFAFGEVCFRFVRCCRRSASCNKLPQTLVAVTVIDVS
jgi:hypothetical protein